MQALEVADMEQEQKFDVKNISFGCELEWSDIDRRIDIPEELGSWEGPKIAGRYTGSEIDIVNTRGRWRGHGTDPLCMKCPVGGEIHVNPTRTVNSQLLRVLRILDLFPTVDVACTNHGHIHVGMPGILQDLKTLKNIFAYVEMNEMAVLENCVGYTKEEGLKVAKAQIDEWVKEYLLCGDGKKIHPNVFARVKTARSVSEVLTILQEERAIDFFYHDNSQKITENSHRTAINLYNLVRMETIEFRIFRASINPVEIYSSLMFVQRFIQEAVKGVEGKPVVEILKEGQFKFARLNFNEELAQGWQKTRSSKGACGCLKKSQGVIPVSEDPILVNHEFTSFETGLYNILTLCELDFEGSELIF